MINKHLCITIIATRSIIFGGMLHSLAMGIDTSLEEKEHHIHNTYSNTNEIDCHSPTNTNNTGSCAQYCFEYVYMTASSAYTPTSYNISYDTYQQITETTIEQHTTGGKKDNTHSHHTPGGDYFLTHYIGSIKLTL